MVRMLNSTVPGYLHFSMIVYEEEMKASQEEENAALDRIIMQKALVAPNLIAVT